MLPDLSRLTLGPPGPPAPESEQTGAPSSPRSLTSADFVEVAVERAKAARRDADRARQAGERELQRARHRFPDLYGSRVYPGVLKSTEKEHRQIAALMCYTKGWDKLLNKWLGEELVTTPPTWTFRDMVGSWTNIQYKEGYWCMYAMFMDDSEFLRYLTNGGQASSPLQFSVDPVNYCSLKELNTLEKLEMRVSSIPMVVISADAQTATTRQVVPAEQVILDGVKELLPKLFDQYDTDYQAASSLFNEAVKNMLRELFSCFQPISRYKVAPCDLDLGFGSGKYVLYKGATIEIGSSESYQDAADVNPGKLVSASRSIETAMRFIEDEFECCLNVFLLDPECSVLDVNAFMGTAKDNKNLICFEDECELIIEPGQRYYKIGSTSQALEDSDIARLIATTDYKITDQEMGTLGAQNATWWMVRPDTAIQEDSDDETDE